MYLRYDKKAKMYIWDIQEKEIEYLFIQSFFLYSFITKIFIEECKEQR